MSFKMSLWQVDGSQLTEVKQSKLDAEDRLEEWIAKDPQIAGLNLLIIGRQVNTDYGGRIDLLGVDEERHLVILELKRDRTPREVVAQILDYASWINGLTEQAIDRIATEYLKRPLLAAFQETFGGETMPEFTTEHRMVIIASLLDDASERIVQYLASVHGVNINAVFFNYYKVGAQEMLGRAWLMDPEAVQERAEYLKRPPWSGYYFVNVGHCEHRSWEDNVRYGYIGAGQGIRYSNSLKKLNPGDIIFAYLAGEGYVGYGEVTQSAVMVKDFIVPDAGKALLDLNLQAPRADANRDDPDMAEWAVGVNWLKTFPRDQAKTFSGVFANPNIVCKLRHPETVEFVKREFNVTD